MLIFRPLFDPVFCAYSDLLGGARAVKALPVEGGAS